MVGVRRQGHVQCEDSALAGHLDGIVNVGRELGRFFVGIEVVGQQPGAEAGEILQDGHPNAPGAENAMELWRGFIEDQAGGTLENLNDILEDQSAFAKFARQMISDLGYGDQLGDDPDQLDEDMEDEAEEGAEEEQDPDSTGQDDQEEDEAEGSAEQSQEDQQDASEAQVSMDDMADQELGEEAEMPEGDAPLEPPAPQPISDADPNYLVYLDSHDEVIGAEELAEPVELERLRAYLDQQLEPLKGAVSRLANKLQRRL